ncbi:uncharacterized protein G2W53_033651 [Senna tora]|uniref:Uncharacterized protein n=1 Tax=Senna tora TaxID=362788 RepID=A0A834W766_9FABA|nr:uncharacterized protein G2W53_033651 [Senna tora]
MLRHDPPSSQAKTTPIGASKPLRFANTTRTDVFDSLAQQVFCLVSEIGPRFDFPNMLRPDPRSSHAKTTPIGASKPIRFANTTRTDVFDSLAQQVFCLVIRECFLDPTAICHPEYVETCSTLHPWQDESNWSIKTTLVFEIQPRFVVRNMLRQDPRSSHAKRTPIGASKPLRFANTTGTDVFDSLAQQVVCLIIREDESNWSIKTTPVREYNANRRVFAYATSLLPRNSFLRSDCDLSSRICGDMMHAPPMPRRIQLEHQNHFGSRTDVFDSLAQQVFSLVSEIQQRFVVRNMLRQDTRTSHAKTTPIGASKPLRFLRSDCDLSSRICGDMIHAPPMPRRIQLEHQNHFGSRTDVFDSFAQQVSEIRQRFVFRNMLRHDPCSSHAKTNPTGASKPLWFANTTRTDVFDSLAQQVFCLVIREEIRARFLVRNMLRLDPRFSHAKTTPIGASKPLPFANTTRTDVLSLAQQVFCLVIRERFRDPSAICRPEYVVT